MPLQIDHPDPVVLQFVRRAVLGLVALGTASIVVELLLISHDEDVNQLIPLAVCAVGLAVLAWVAIAPGVAALRTMQFVMLTYAGSGLIGIVLHFEANVALQREIDPSIDGRELLVQVVQSTAPPALAPGLLVQLGLLGLLYTYQHPALSARQPHATDTRM